MDDHEVEQILRTALERRSAETDVTAPVVDRVRAAAAGRRRTRWSVGVAAAAVLVVVGGVAVATRGGDAEQQPVVDQGTTTDAGPDRVGEWRTEYWGPVAVDVPADWGYGSAPGAAGPLTVCAPGHTPGYVGRPIVLTDVCVYLRSGWQPTAPYVWLGAAVEPGTYEWDNGYIQETVEVAGTTVTVGTDDPSLRERILASARAEHICPPRRTSLAAGRRENSVEGVGSLREAAVCAYRRAESGFELTYSAPVPESALRATWSALDAAPAINDTDACRSEEFVVLSSIYNDPYSEQRDLWLHWDAVFRPDCGDVDAGPAFFEESQRIVRLSDRVVEPWANDGVRAVLFYFIGPQG